MQIIEDDQQAALRPSRMQQPHDLVEQAETRVLSLATIMGPWLPARGPGAGSRADIRERVLGGRYWQAPMIE
jgi:hypothetical protein